jgi:phosphotriesterase-related protein
MPYVNTVLGPFHPEQLGVTLMHEHILWSSPGWEYSPEAKRIFDAPKVLEHIYNDLVELRETGGRTLVDVSGIGIGRDPEILVTLSRWSGVNIVACTGFWQQQKILPYFAERDVDYMTELFVQELTVGMGTTAIKAGIIKVGCSRDAMHPLEERTFRAAARASKRTGAAITTHGSWQVARQVEVFVDEGVDPTRVVLGHLEDGTVIDPQRDRELARLGYNLGYDHIGLEELQFFYATTDDRRLKVILEMIDGGYINQMVLSNDTDGWSLGLVQRGNYQHTYAHLIKNFLPRLRKAGVAEEQIHTLLVENPKRILAISQS